MIGTGQAAPEVSTRTAASMGFSLACASRRL
jgi:hypothetical protein